MQRMLGCTKAARRGVHAAMALAVAATLAGCQTQSNPVADLSTAVEIRAILNRSGSDAAAGGAALSEPQGFADFTGSFKIVGQGPTLPPLTVTSDVAVCAPGGKLPPDESVVLGADGGLANVVIYLNSEIPSDDPKWEHESYAAARDAFLAGEEGFDQKDCIFLSRMFVMRSTQTLEILNSDPVGHNTNIAGEGRAASSNAIIAAGGKSTYAPGGASRQPFTVVCNIHNWMKAYMLVRNDPYFAVSGPDGSFTIPNVPAGVKLEFRVWHEKLGSLQNVTVSVNGDAPAAQKWSKGRFDLTLAPDMPHQLDVTVDAALLR